MPEIDVVRTADVSPPVLAEIRDLMDAAFSGDFDADDWDHTLGGWHIVVSEGGVVVAHAAVVERTLEVDGRSFRTGYVEGVATTPGCRRRGLGTLAMTESNGIIRRDFELGALGTGEWGFYEPLGWERWHGPTHVRTASALVRTPEDDDGVMVLRCGPSTTIDLSSSIACDQRAGDVW